MQLDRRFYDISETLKNSTEGKYVHREKFSDYGRWKYVNDFGWQSVVLPAMQWFTQAPAKALAWWFNEYRHFSKEVRRDSVKSGTHYDQASYSSGLSYYYTAKLQISRHPFDLINETEAACQNAISTLTAAKETCADTSEYPDKMGWEKFSFTGHGPVYDALLRCNGGWFESIADFESTNALVEAIDEHLSKTIKNIEESGGYNIIVRTQILDGTMYKIDKNGVQYRQQTLPSFGNWWSKNVKITRQDGLDVIFIPISTDT